MDEELAYQGAGHLVPRTSKADDLDGDFVEIMMNESESEDPLNINTYLNKERSSMQPGESPEKEILDNLTNSRF